MTVETLKALSQLQKDIHENAVRHGFYDKVEKILDHLAAGDSMDYMREVEMYFILAQLDKIASEVGEATDAIQRGKPQAEYAEELADIFIRLLDLAEYQGISIGVAVGEKMQKNALRPYLHGKRC